jgi:hypothetical protein
LETPQVFNGFVMKRAGSHNADPPLEKCLVLETKYLALIADDDFDLENWTRTCSSPSHSLLAVVLTMNEVTAAVWSGSIENQSNAKQN